METQNIWASLGGLWERHKDKVTIDSSGKCTLHSLVWSGLTREGELWYLVSKGGKCPPTPLANAP